MDNRVQNRKIWFALPVLALIWGAASVKLLALPVRVCISYLAFLLFLVFLPGYTMLSLFQVELFQSERIALSFGLGFVIEFVLYFIFVPLGFPSLIPYALIAVSIILLILLAVRIRKKIVAVQFGAFDISLFLVCSLAMAITFVILSMANLEPNLVGARNFYHDTLNGVGLTVAASRSFPMTSLQMSGWVFPYHLGYYIFTSTVMRTLNVTAFVAVMKLSLILISPLCVLCFTALADRIGIRGSLRSVIPFVFAMIPSFGFMHYLYMDTIGFPFGLIFCFLSLIVFAHAQERNKKLNLLHILASVFLCAGMISKGPLAVTYLFGICFVLLIELISKRNLYVFPKGLTYAVPFFVVYWLIYGQGAGDSMSVSFFYSATRTPFSYSIYEKMPDWLYKTLSVGYYSISISLVTTVSLLAVIICSFILLKRHSIFDIFSLSTVLCGMVLINVMKQMGSSEIYFLSGVYPVCFLCGTSALDELWERREGKKGKVFAAVLTLLLLLALPQDVTDSYGLFMGDDCTKMPSASALKSALTYSISNYKQGKSVDLTLLRGPIITPEEYEAFIWLKENTPENAVFSDYRYSTNNKYFCGSVFSERSCFLEGWGYVTMEDSNNNTDEKIRRDTIVRFFNDTKQESFSLLLAQEGVQYLIFEKVVTGDWELSDTFVDEIFRNDSMIIYYIRPRELR